MSEYVPNRFNASRPANFIKRCFLQIRSLKFHVLIIYLPLLLMDFAANMIFTNTSFYISSLRLSSTFLGILMAVMLVAFIVSSVPFGRLSDRIERRYLLYAGCLVMTGTSIGLAYCQNRFQLMLVFPCVGISIAMFWPVYEAWLADRESAGSLIKRIMFFNIAWCMGTTLGPTLVGYLYTELDQAVLFFFSGGLSLLAFATIAWVSTQKQEVPDTEPPEIAQEFYGFRSQRFAEMHLKVARYANFTSYFALNTLRRLVPKLLKELGMPLSRFGNLMLVLGGAQILTFLYLGREESQRWHYRFKPMVVVQGLAILCFLVLWRVHSTPLWIVGLVGIGIFGSFAYFTSLYYGLDTWSVEKGNNSGWHEAVGAAGMLGGPLIGGILSDAQRGFQVENWDVLVRYRGGGLFLNEQADFLSPYLLCAAVIVIAVVIEASIVSKGTLSPESR